MHTYSLFYFDKLAIRCMHLLTPALIYEQTHSLRQTRSNEHTNSPSCTYSNIRSRKLSLTNIHSHLLHPDVNSLTPAHSLSLPPRRDHRRG